MTAPKNAQQRSRKRTASTSVAQLQCNVARETPSTNDLFEDAEFLIPNELSTCAVGLFHCLTTRRVIPLSFYTLYEQSRKAGWLAVLTRERRNLKSNINSTEKCFMFNRLIHRCRDNPDEFTREIRALYDSVAKQLINTGIKFEDVDEWCKHVVSWQSSQSYRRLFHVKRSETNQSSTVFDLQRGAAEFFTTCITSAKDKSSTLLSPDRYNQLRRILQHIFIITIQPSTVECAGGTKYDKVGHKYISKLNSRLLCLLDADVISKHLSFSNVDVTLFPFDRKIDPQGEEQTPLEWQQRTVIDADGISRSFFFADLQSIRLNEVDGRNARPLYSSKLCQIQYKIQVQIPSLGVTEDLTFLTRPFGLCSHAQYFPEYLAKIFLYEFETLSHTVDSSIVLPLMTDFICRYHTKICGVPVQNHTREFIMQTIQRGAEHMRGDVHSDAFASFEGILAKFFSQMEFFVDHPFLSMMYQDGLFRGICDGSIDKQLRGTRDQPKVLLRFNALVEHQSTQQAAVHYIAHNGRLIKASFHMKAFVDEMCRMLYESADQTIVVPRIYSDSPNLDFRSFQLYYDPELIRISGIEPASQEAYKPLIPVLWATLRTTVSDDNPITPQERSNSPVSLELESTKPPFLSMTDSSKKENDACSNKKRPVITSDQLIKQIIEQFSDVSIEYREEQTLPNNVSNARSSFIHLGNEEKEKLSEVLQKYLRVMAQTSLRATTAEHTCADSSLTKTDRS